jgi:hypothetical protein
LALFGLVVTLDFEIAGFETALLACFFAGAGAAILRAAGFVFAAAATGRLPVVGFFLLEAALLAGIFFAVAAVFAGFADFLVLLLAGLVALTFVALRAGAFSAADRLTIGLGFAAFPANARFLAEVRREAGLEGDLLIPLIVGSLMRSSRLSKKLLKKSASRHLNLRAA